MSNMESQFEKLNVRVSALEVSLAENNKATKQIEANTADIVDFTTSIKGAMKVLNMIAALAKPIGYIFSFGLAIWGVVLAIKAGVTPK